MTVSEKVSLVREVSAAVGLSAALRMVELPRSTWYYQRRRRAYTAKYRHLRRPLQTIATRHAYGYRRTTTELHERYHFIVNRKVVARLHRCWELRLRRAVRRPKPNPLRHIVLKAGKLANLVAQRKTIRPLEVLYTDFTELCYGGGKARLMALVDEASKVVVGWSLGQSSTTELALEAWEGAKAFLRRHGHPLTRVIVHHDRDPAYTSHDWVGQLLLIDGVRVSYSLQGAKGNVAMESWNGHFKQDNRSFFQEAETIEELRSVVAKRLRYYNQGRRHSTLKDQHPLAYLRGYLRSKAKVIA